MALDPNEIISEGWLEKPDDFEGIKIPDGVDASSGKYYAYQRTYRDGRRVIEWRQRGTGSGGKDDPILTTSQDTVKGVKDRWEKDSKDEAQTANKPPEERNNNGRRERWNAQTQKWDDVGPAVDTSATAGPGRATIGRIEGTPLPGGGYDNTQPIWVERDANGQQIGSAKPLTQPQRDDWERQKNGGKTDAEIRAQNSPEARVGKPTGNTRTRSVNGTTTKETEYQLPDGSTVWRSQTETTQPDQVGKPTGNTRQTVNGGQTVKEIEYVLPDGTKEWRAQSETASPLPKDLPQFTFNWLDPGGDGGLGAYASAIRARPDLTDKQKAELITAAHSTATTVVGQATSVINAQENTRSSQVTQRGQDMSQANARLSQAGTDFANAQKATADTTKYATGDVSGVMPYYMALAHAAGSAYGGFNTPPPVQGGPAIQQVGQMGIPGQGIAGMLPLPTGAPPAVAQGVQATQAAAANPTGANVQAANDATMQGSNAAFGALGINPQNDALRGMNMGPIGPSNLFPTPKPTGLGAMIQPTSGQPEPQAYQPTGQGAMLMQRANGYDPTGLNAQLLAAGLDPEVIRMMGGVG